MDVVKISFFLIGSSFLPIILLLTSKQLFTFENILENRTNVKYLNPIIRITLASILICIFAVLLNHQKQHVVYYVTLLLIITAFVLKDLGGLNE